MIYLPLTFCDQHSKGRQLSEFFNFTKGDNFLSIPTLPGETTF